MSKQYTEDDKLFTKDITEERALVSFFSAYVLAGMPNDSWYFQANEDVKLLADWYRVDFELVAAVVAVLSPAQRWDWDTVNGIIYPNLNAASAVLNAYVKGYDIDSIMGKGRGGGYSQNKKKAWHILQTGTIEQVKGPKVFAFFDNLLNPSTSKLVTADRWIGRAFLNDANFPDSYLSAIYGKKAYSILSGAISTIANIFGVSPLAAQAGIWNYTRYQGGENTRGIDNFIADA